MCAIAILASLAILIILVLCVPLNILLRIDTNEKPKFKIRLAWLFGLVSKEAGREKKKPEDEWAAEHERKPGSKREKAAVIFKVLRTEGLLKQLGSLSKGVLSRIRIRELGVDLRVGLDSPADTGLLFAYIAPANLLLGSFSPHEIRIQPSFADNAVLEGYLYGVARLEPIQVVPPLIGFTFSPPTMRAIKTLVLSRWKRKN